uniref:uncharacterized protein n=1 Tax=Myxine glutinosa TaxID=7769 RepID=UPI00358EF8F4
MDDECSGRQCWYPPRFNPQLPNPEEKFLHHKLFVGLDEDVEGFDVCSSILGPGGTFLGHVEFETGAKVQLCGGRFAQHADEPLHMLISHVEPDGLHAARNLCKDLLDWGKEKCKKMDDECSGRQCWYPPRFNPQLPNPEEKFLHHKLFVGLDEDVEGFDVCSSILGPGGIFLGHVEVETGAKVQLCGGRFAQHADEPLHMLISHVEPDGLHAARNLCKDLLDWVYSELETFQRQTNMQPQTSFGRYARPHSPPGNTSYTEDRQKHQGQWPKKHSRNADSSRSPWITPEVLDLIEQKRKANIMRLKKPSPSNEEAFRILRSRVQSEVRRLKERSMPGRRRIQQLEKQDFTFDSLSDTDADSPGDGDQKDSVTRHKVDVEVNPDIGMESNSLHNLNTEPNRQKEGK